MFIPSIGGVPAKDPPRRYPRNFLRENRLMAGQRPKMESKVLKEYNRNTTAPLAKRSGVQPQVPHRFSEKQVQTEDISDERFLSAAMLKCSEKGNFRPARSEGDEPELREGESWGKRLSLRRTASSFELGRMPEQRDGYQSGQYTLHRPLAIGLGIVPSGCSCHRRAFDESFSGIPSSRPSSPRVRQMDIPEMVDADLEEELSVRSSCEQILDSPPEKPKQELEEVKPQVDPEPEEQSQEQLQFEPNLMPDELRIMLLEAALERQSQLTAEYNRLPLSMGTLRVRNLKCQLELQLDVVERDVSVLSQPNTARVQQLELLNCNRKRLFR